MDKPNLFKEDTDFNICKSWLCDSTDGQTYSICDHFVKKMHRPAGMGEKEWGSLTEGFCNWQVWEDTIGWKHDYLVDDPEVDIEAQKMVEGLNELIAKLNENPHFWHEPVFLMECKKAGKDYFSFEFHGKKEIACKFCADLVISEMGDGDGENVDKESLKKFTDEIAEYFLVAGNYAYADCTFDLREVVDEEGE